MKNRKPIQMMLVSCLIGMAGIASADQVVLGTSDDNWVNGNSPDTTFAGAATAIRHQNASWGNNYALFKYDLAALPANIEVTSVRMRFYTALQGWPGPTNFAPVAVFNNTQDWDESTVTFNNAPTSSASPAETLDHFGITANPVYFTGANTIEAGGWMEFEGAGTVALVQGWADGTINNFGISMRGTGDYLSDGRLFRPQTKENENAGVRPTLIVNYTTIPEPATLGLIGFVAAGMFAVRRFMSM